MFALNLPDYPYKIRTIDGKRQLFDGLRHKYVALTPEEWVRQHFVNYLITIKGYPPERLVNEAQIRLNGLVRRCDTVLYDKELQPLVIVEYKAPSVAITQKVFEQVTTYNWALRVRYLIVSNGLVNYCCSVDYEAQRVDFLSDIPDYAQLM
ncbi:MAG: type I restriction enzyme HsdR N-terminal domain-containing protein [Bacteroidota bacterium]|nr:type I restriction enzyme HsdR N-terminal domain-containing protein [Bacteroidota bacterium]